MSGNSNACFFAGCSATNSSVKKENSTSYTAKAGKATALDFKKETSNILTNRFSYQIVRTEETTDQIYFETNWQYRVPFEDEKILGIADARSRIKVNARPRIKFRQEEPWPVTVICDNEVRLQNSQAWIEMPLTDMTMEYFRSIVRELRIEYDMGIRVY